MVGLVAFDGFRKTRDELQERTLGGACISITCCIFATLLFAAEFSHYRSYETVDRLGVDTTTPATSKLPVNLDVYFPSLPCSEIVLEVVDESGTQQIAVTDSLLKLRTDRNGVPIDLPQPVDWEHAIAPGFQQRKMIQLMEEAHSHLSETLSHLTHEDEENPTLSAEEHEAHRAQLAQQAAFLQGRLEQITEAADVHAGAEESAEEAEKLRLELTAQELSRMRDEVARTRLYSAAQREQVLSNLHSMARNVARLQNGSIGSTTTNLKEALRIRLSILNDNVLGFVSSEDIDRRARYASIRTLLEDVSNATAGLPPAVAEHMETTVAEMRRDLEKLSAGGVGGAARAALEARLDAELRSLRADLRGEVELAEGYCGSCYGAATDPSRCCNSCDEIREAYRERRWGFPDENTFEQCRRDARLRHTRVEEGEGCNLFGTMQVARVTGSLNLAPTSTVRQLGGALRVPARGVLLEDMRHFNVTHHIKRLSFGTDFPGQKNPLDDVWTHSPGGPAVSRYFLKVVPTTYEFLNGKVVETNQFSTTQYFRPLDLGATSAMLPRISFTFELTPLKVEKKEQRAGTFLRFLTRSAAVVGGLFTVAGILDSAWYHSARHLMKVQMNKAS
ncbi:hypothetical protein AB1Y20_010665 [Prymnesium parvum]|uniref:Endoplasmic reticulum vesicle transporter C-terminal domain-containing protein n=1 Tax=Prymnesium parvum TaxID=97485 RepID=A0AB34IP82_PRYPA